MKKFTQALVWGVSLTILLITYLSVAQGWGVKNIQSKSMTSKYASLRAPYGVSNKRLLDSSNKAQKHLRDSLKQRRKDSIKVVETRFNATRDSLRAANVNLVIYQSGRYQYAYGYRPSSSYQNEDYSSSSGYSSGGYRSRSGGYSSGGSFRSSSRSFRGGSRRGGK